MIDAGIITALIALVTSIVAVVVGVLGQRNLRLLEERLERQQASAAFQAQKLDQFYLPITMHLSTTQKLFGRFLEADDKEKVAIEHELRIHNTKIRECLMDASIYLEDDAPEGMIEELLEHLIQWEIVYKLKYEHQVYSGPVFAGIDQFGFRGFPAGDVDGYFKRKVKELKSRHHARLRESHPS